MIFVLCIGEYTPYQVNYGPFANMSIAALWLESHCPTKIGGTHCDDGLSKENHKIHLLRDPMKGISRRAEVDLSVIMGN